MSGAQRLLTAILPRQPAQDLGIESHAWKLPVLGYGHTRSVWGAGGIRWKAAGNQVCLSRYPACDRLTSRPNAYEPDTA